MSPAEHVIATAEQIRGAAAQSRPAFFPVSPTKLAVMSVCTFGLYQVYWFYENWRHVKRRERSHISAPWRSVFGALFCYPLFRRITSTSRQFAFPAPPAALLFFAWLAVSLLSYSPAPYLLLSFASVVFILPIQRAVNRINQQVAPRHDPNRRFGAGNIVAVLFGGLLVALSAIGAFLSLFGHDN